ncbi:hypothetical protein DUNSADRAFT_4723 [Dunaliella salina]|uniref:Encoded protein n=1 Tax=Dunaliella salina TaxID=3046 RepID=A0ABQ7H7K2_DUNSA|nr:hypothetical protein DUNSADRAFT_4723 [Dunaliella salina]|eukprot:KAF5842839.1 hypothetical protein DUNSADRAFT_4723 [Dunaliella salina]
MDNLSRIASFFPTGTITVYVIIENLVINDTSSCVPQQRDLTIALLIIFSFLHTLCCFTDSYVTSTSTRVIIFMVPFYGPLSNGLPTEYERDKVYENYFLKGRDYAHALVSTTTFVLIMIFTNPISMCLFPSGNDDGTTRFDSAIMRAVPIVVAIIMGLIMMCLGNPRQMMGMPLSLGPANAIQPNSPQVVGDNPVFNNKFPPDGGLDTSTIGDEETGSLDMSFAPLPPGKPYLPANRPNHMSGPGDHSVYAGNSRPRSPRDVSMQMGRYTEH